MFINFTKRATGILVVLFLFFSQFTNLPIANPLIAGRNISVYLGYLVVVASFFLFLDKIVQNNGRFKIDECFFVLGILFTLLMSILSGSSFDGIWNEMFAFLVPILLVYPIKYSQIKQSTLLNVLFVASLTGGILSLLIAIKVIDVDKWTAVGDLVRTAGFIDGTLGVIGFCCAIVYLINAENKFSLIAALIGLVGAGMIVAFGLSRLRIAILIGVFFVVLLTKKPNKDIRRKINLVLIIVLIISFIIYMFPDVVNTVLRMIDTRFSAIGTDDNTSYRVREMKIHLQKLVQSFGLGTGWGVRDSMEEVFVHNVYTGLLMHCGLIFGSYYIYYLLKQGIRSYKGIHVENKDQYCANMLSFVAMMVVIFSGFGGAGITQPGAWFALAIVYSKGENK